MVKGSDRIESELSLWSISLYIVFFSFFYLCFSKFGSQIVNELTMPQQVSGWFVNGFKYASYNLGFIPGVLFATRHIQSSKQALGAGVLAGLFGVLPGLFFYFAMVSQYPIILDQTVPSSHMLALLGHPALTVIFYVVLFATLIATGTGLIHAFNERFVRFANEKKITLPRHFRFGIALFCMVVSVIVSQVGLKTLVAKGYGLMSWIMMLAFIGPLLTIGLIKIINNHKVSGIAGVRAN